MTLRPYQHTFRESIAAEFRAGHRQVLGVAPTGAGKTITFCDMAERALARGKSVGILMHRSELIQQTRRALGAVPHGVIQSGHPEKPRALQIASIQTLVNRMDRYQFDFLIVDEAHHCTASTYRRVLDHYSNAHVLGVTATPCRTDGTGLADAGYTAMVLGPDIDTLTEEGWLAPCDVYGVPTVDVTGVKTTAGDYNRRALAEVMDRPSIVGDAIKHYRRFCDGQPAIAFCVSVAHAEHVAAEFSEAGYRAASIDGKMSAAEREQRITALGNGGLQVLTSCDLISEGVDVPVVVAGIMLRPTQSRGLWYQQIGRILRTAEGKTHAVVIDHVGNTAKHGLPWGGQMGWTLEGKKRKSTDEPAVPVRVCLNCFRAHAPAPVCPYCAAVYPVKARELTQIEGELVKIENAWKRKEERRACKTLEELEALGRAKGYKPGWARVQWGLRRKRLTAG